jgi:hypothetical protein
MKFRTAHKVTDMELERKQSTCSINVTCFSSLLELNSDSAVTEDICHLDFFQLFHDKETVSYSE